MNTAKKERLAKAGWKTGTAAEFLHLTPEEELYVELKASLCQKLARSPEPLPEHSGAAKDAKKNHQS